MRKLFAAAFLAVMLSASFVTTAPLLAGCATLGVARPQTFDEKMVAGYKSVEALADSALLLLDAGKISIEDAKNVHEQASTAKGGLDVARQIHDGGDFASAESRLQAIIVGLGALQVYLATREK